MINLIRRSAVAAPLFWFAIYVPLAANAQESAAGGSVATDQGDLPCVEKDFGAIAFRPDGPQKTFAAIATPCA